MTNENPKSSEDVSENESFTEVLTPVLTGLLYPSESDEPVETVSCPLRQDTLLTTSQIKDWLLLPPSVFVEDIPETDFWEPVTTMQDWYEEEEKVRTTRFQQLKELLEKRLTERQVFRVGETEIEVYLLGRTPDGERAGIKTKLVQT